MGENSKFLGSVAALFLAAGSAQADCLPRQVLVGDQCVSPPAAPTITAGASSSVLNSDGSTTITVSASGTASSPLQAPSCGTAFGPYGGYAALKIVQLAQPDSSGAWSVTCTGRVSPQLPAGFYTPDVWLRFVSGIEAHATATRVSVASPYARALPTLDYVGPIGTQLQADGGVKVIFTMRGTASSAVHGTSVKGQNLGCAVIGYLNGVNNRSVGIASFSKLVQPLGPIPRQPASPGKAQPLPPHLQLQPRNVWIGVCELTLSRADSLPGLYEVNVGSIYDSNGIHGDHRGPSPGFQLR